MLQPINGHLLIDPVKHDGFIASQHDTFEEIGIVLAIAQTVVHLWEIEVGDRVYFDSWLAAKYPKEGTDEYYYLIKYEDVRAVEKNTGAQ